MDLSRTFGDLFASISAAPDANGSWAELRARNLTMPPGALARLIDPAVQLCTRRQKRLRLPDEHEKLSEPLRISTLLFAADHQITRTEPISAFPREVTGQMVLNFINGGAAQSVLSSRHAKSLTVVDVGVASLELERVPKERSSPPQSAVKFQQLRPTRKDYLEGCPDPRLSPSLGTETFLELFNAGRKVTRTIIERDGPDILVLGEMGIGNTTCSTAIAELLTGQKSLSGRGTGVIDSDLEVKKRVVAEISSAFRSRCLVANSAGPLGRKDFETLLHILPEVGGLEHAALAGAFTEAASNGVSVVLDGLIVTSALAPLVLASPQLKEWIIGGHAGSESAHKALLDCLQIETLIQLDLRLGEGSGATLACGLLSDGFALLTQMATFDQAGVESKQLPIN